MKTRMGPSQKRILGSALLLATAVVLAQTGGCGPGERDNRSLTNPSLFAQAYAQALCGSLKHCCDENEVQFDNAQCTDGWRLQVNNRFADPVRTANYDTRSGDACYRLVAAAQNVTCAPDPGSISDARTTCQQIFVGKKPLGTRCASSAECAPIPGLIVGCEGQPIVDPDAGLLPLSSGPGLHMQALPDGPPVCVALKPVEAGQSCGTAALKSLCNLSALTFCDTDGVCKNVPQAGEACNDVGGCKPGLFCDRGLCSPKGGAGDPCTSNVACATLLRCDGARCVERKRPGEACASDDECSIGVCDATTRRCLKNAIATTSACLGKEPLRP